MQKKYNLIRYLDYADMVDHSNLDGLVEEAKVKYKDSIVKTDVIYEIAKEDTICNIGEVSDQQYKKYEKEFLKIYA